MVAQKKGWSRRFPPIQGALNFRIPTEAMEYMGRVVKEYRDPPRSERRMAEKYFGAGNVCGNLLERA